jgi:hypothetical protein
MCIRPSILLSFCLSLTDASGPPCKGGASEMLDVRILGTGNYIEFSQKYVYMFGFASMDGENKGNEYK